MAQSAVIVAARRTAVVPRNGAFAAYQADELAAPVLSQLVIDAGLSPNDIDQVILGNALYGGGNPARLAALRAGLPQSAPAMTIDTQCCSGLDAIVMAVRLVESGAATAVLAGGAESYSRSAIRYQRPISPECPPVPYERPPFAPPPFSDPDLAEAAAQFGKAHKIDRGAQAAFAVRSHEKAAAADWDEAAIIVPIGEQAVPRDPFSRRLSLRAALRAPVFAGTPGYGVSAATAACSADCAAAVLVMAEERALALGLGFSRVVAARSGAGDPANPTMAPVPLVQQMLREANLETKDLSAIELMEAFASQVLASSTALGVPEDRLNKLGGALARGHPIGASGAVLAVHLDAILKAETKPVGTPTATGLAAIPAAGGLASAIFLQRGRL